MRFKFIEYPLNSGLFTGWAIDITLLYIRSNSNTRGPLTATITLKSESPDFNYQDVGQWYWILLRHWLVISTPTSLPLPSWHFQFITSQRQQSVWRTTVSKRIPLKTSVCEQHVTMKIFRAGCSLSDADSHLFPELENFLFVQCAFICITAPEYTGKILLLQRKFK
jgi:hypothetical protein